MARGARQRLDAACLAVAVLTVTALYASVSATDVSTIEVSGQATERAERGEQFQLTPLPPPPPPACRRVVIIGDSLTANGLWWHQEELDDAGFVGYVDAQPSRRIPSTVRVPYSGVTATRQVRATWGEADCWVIALGSNDLIYGAGVASTASALITEQLAAVTPNARVWWVNVDYHPDPRTSFDFVAATAGFNRELSRRAAADDRLDVIDWYSFAEANRGWFFDPVHVDAAGTKARAALVVSALPR